MPVPEQLRLYGRTDLLVAIGDQQPPPPPPPPATQPGWAQRQRQVTRTLTLHFTHGWIAGNWRHDGRWWYGANFNIDLDGTLYQCEEMNVQVNHVGGAPHFRGLHNPTSVSVEMARFGRPLHNGATYSIDGYAGINFRAVTTWPAECDYSAHGGSNPAGTRRYKLDKIPGGTVLQNTSRNRAYYYVKVATFNDARNADRAATPTAFPDDLLFTEEQSKTIVAWVKCMCEMNRIPKQLLRNPASGTEQPWIDTNDLVQAGGSVAIRNENIERIRAFQGIVGHNNVQGDRADPGPSMDFYRIKRGIRDEWWYPVNRDDTTRAINYLDAARVADYMAMIEHNDATQLPNYFSDCEGTEGGYYPVGANHLWHGGIHLEAAQSRPVYAMANGRIVAARVSNGDVNTTQQCIELRYSRCFVLIRHPVHVRDNGAHAGEIDYGNNSTEDVYSLYMHLRPLEPQFDANGQFQVDYTAHPVWFNHYMIDHPTDTAPGDGTVFYPDVPVDLSDLVGYMGDYIVGYDSDRARFGPSLHLEVFTNADVAQFAGSPWALLANRVEDTTPDIACNLTTLNTWLVDLGLPGIDAVDVQRAIPRMHSVAARFRSEWSLTDRTQLSQELVVGDPTTRVGIADVVTEDQWLADIKPLCFHAEMQGQADVAVVGAFLNDPIVWHLHPLEFMRWMNERVSRHEQSLASQDKRLTVTSNIVVQAGYVTTFAPAVPVRAPAGGYREISWSENTYEVNVDALCDPVDLATAPQTATRFHLRLLEAIDMINDEPHGLRVLLAYVSAVTNAHSVRAARHNQGHAIDTRPASGVSAVDWFRFQRKAQRVLDYYHARDGANSLALEMLQDAAPPGRQQIEATVNSGEWLRRLRAATSETDAVLTAAGPAFPNLQAELGQMRLHLYIP